jgi:hypothetical protein
LYFVDADSFIRDHHLGERRYERSERVIQRLLSVERQLVPSKGSEWRHDTHRYGGRSRMGALSLPSHRV